MKGRRLRGGRRRLRRRDAALLIRVRECDGGSAITAAAGLILALPAVSQETTAPPTWRNADASQRAIKDLAGQFRPTASLATIGTSLEGRNINVRQLAREGAIEPGERPAVLVVAGIDASRPHTSWCAVEVARTLLDRAAAGDAVILGKHSVYSLLCNRLIE